MPVHRTGSRACAHCLITSMLAPAQGPAGVPPVPGGPPAAVAGRGGGPGGQPPVTVNNQTLRQIVRTSIGGNRVRIVLSNAFGTAPVQIGAATV